MDRPLAEAYSQVGAAWDDGPMRVYGRLAELLVGHCGVPLAGAPVLDLGAGTGAASRAIAAAGGRPVAVDMAVGMLEAAPAGAVVAAADALALPFDSGRFQAVVAAFSLNHVVDLPAGLREAARVTRPGGVVVASGYAAGDHHPAREAVEQALTERGWAMPGWYHDLKAKAIPGLATEAAAAAAARAAGLAAEVTTVSEPFDHLSAPDLVAWRMGMAYCAPFVSGLEPRQRAELRARAVELLGDPPPLVRSMIILRIAP